jgi:excisionase family DNA binding protein
MYTSHSNPFEAIRERFDKLERLIHGVNEHITKPPDPNPFERITRKQITHDYKVSLGMIHNAMKRGDLPFEKVGRKTLFKRAEVEAWISNKKNGLNNGK